MPKACQGAEKIAKLRLPAFFLKANLAIPSRENLFEERQWPFLAKNGQRGTMGQNDQVGFAMRSVFLKGCLVFPLLLAGCGSQQDEEEVDYDHMVNNEEEVEWTSGPDPDRKHLAGDVYPEPQEIIVEEGVDAPSRLDVSMIR